MRKRRSPRPPAEEAAQCLQQGRLRLAARDHAGAEPLLRRALALAPQDLEAHLSLGAMLSDQRRFEEGLEHYRLALLCWPGAPALWCNRGVLLTRMEDAAAAEACFRRALALDPDYAAARFDLSYLLLRRGQFPEGLEALEARSLNVQLAAQIPAPRWQGQDLTGKALLVGVEGGYGDMLQFARYTGQLKAMGLARLTLICHPPLRRLFTTLPGVDEVIALGATLTGPGWDFWILPQSLPLRCGTTAGAIPAPIPYVRPFPEDLARWASRLPPGPRVGLAWKGNPAFEEDGHRSLPHLATLAPLGAVAGLSFISLQKGAGEAETAPGLDLIPAALDDFADTAALVAQLDLVISTDTAVAHLAGALGRPCWLLLPRPVSDWRWFEDRLDSPWYPGTHRLFRQPRPGDWVSVVAEVAAALGQVKFRAPGSIGDYN